MRYIAKMANCIHVKLKSELRSHIVWKNIISTTAIFIISCFTTCVDIPDTLKNWRKYDDNNKERHNLLQTPIVKSGALYTAQDESIEMRVACLLCKPESRNRLCLRIVSLANIMRDVAMYAPAIIAITTSNYKMYHQYAFTLTSMMTIVGLTKILVKKPRPDNSDSKSFPSGHAAASFVGAMFLLSKCGNLIGIPMLTIATLNSLSRIYCKKHTLLDVVVGAFLGIACAMCSCATMFWFFKKLDKQNT